MPSISLTSREAFNAAQTDEHEIVLVKISHEDWDAPVYLSSDPTEVISWDPLSYGTISNGITYEFVLMQAILPDDQETSPNAASLAFENVDADMAEVIRSVTTPATIDLAVVLASTPDVIEQEFKGLKAVRGSYDAARVALDISRDLIVNEPWPAHRMTQSRFPGLFR